MNLLWSLVILATNNKSQPSKRSSVNVIEVCVSPGCIADGAQGALSKLKALAPPSVCVKSGKCVSLCGKGPVLIQNPDNDKTKVLHRYMNDPKLVPFVKELAAQDLAEDENEYGDEDSNGGLTAAAAAAEILDDLVEGYDLITEGENKLSKKLYAQASDDLREGINKAFQPSQIYGGDMEWMAQAHRSLAESFLAQGPQKCQDAKEAVQVSLDLAPEDLHHLSYELLGRICEAGNDGGGEYRALKAYFDLQEPLDPPREVVNRRRTLGFRFQKLKMEFGGES